MRSLLALLFIVAVGMGCNRSAHDESAIQRADRFNTQKDKARLLVQAGDYPAAITELKRLTSEVTSDHQLYMMLGQAYAGVGSIKDAISSYESAVRLAYTDYHTHLEFAELLAANGKVGRALTEFEIATRFCGNDPVPYHNYGLALRRSGRHEKALQQWETAYGLSPGDPVYTEALAIGYAGIDDERSVMYFEEAVAEGAAGAKFYNNFGLALNRVRNYQRADSMFTVAVAADPSNENFRYNSAVAKMNVGDYDGALAEWDNLTTRFGDTWNYQVYGARAQLELGKFAACLSRLETVVAGFETSAEPKSTPERPAASLSEALEVLGLAHRGLKRTRKALGYLKRAVDLEPRNVSRLNNYGVALAESGNIAEAKAQWEKVLSLDSRNSTARQNLSAINP